MLRKSGQGVVVVRRVDFLDLVAELGDQASGTLDGGDRLGVWTGVDGRGDRETDPQTRGRAVEPRKEPIGGRSGVRRIAGRRANDRIEQCGAVPDAAGDHALGDHPEHHLGALRTVGREATAELEPDQSVAGRGDADRPAAVVRASRRDDARGDRGARATGRATRSVGQVPWVARPAQQVVLGDALGSELGGVGLAEDDESGVEEALRDERVLVGHVVHQRVRAAGGGEPGVLLSEILDQERHAGEGARQWLGDPCVRDVVQHSDDRVDLRVDLVGTLTCQGQQLSRGDLLVDDQGRQGGGVRGQVVVEVHGASVGARHPSGGRNEPKRGATGARTPQR